MHPTKAILIGKFCVRMAPMAALLRLRTWLCVGALLVLSWGCNRQRPARSPKEAVESFGEALARGQLEAAYELLSGAQRAALSFGDFKNKIKSNQLESKAL